MLSPQTLGFLGGEVADIVLYHVFGASQRRQDVGAQHVVEPAVRTEDALAAVPVAVGQQCPHAGDGLIPCQCCVSGDCDEEAVPVLGSALHYEE